MPALKVAFFILLSASLLAAQTAATGALSGSVADQTGAVIPGAEIKVTSAATGEVRKALSSEEGSFTVPLLPPGLYNIDVLKPGFTLTSVKNIAVSVTETTRVPLVLAVGSESVVVNVEVSSTLVQTESSALGRVTDETVVQGLPLVSRNYTQILGLSPGVSGNLTNAGDLGRGSGGLAGTGVGYSAHGARTFDNNFQMNGMGVNDVFAQGATSGGVPVPNPDTIQEFKVQTGQYDAAFGRNAGAAVNVVTRGGSNEFHGKVFEFFRNRALNANNFFSNLNNQKKPQLNQNQFGFTLGGPITKNRLLFFGSYQGTRQINGVASLKTLLSLPLTDDRTPQGIASVLYGPGSAPSDRRGVQQNAAGGAGPAIAADGSNINPVALKLLQLKQPDGTYMMPTPQTISGSGPLSARGFSTFSTPSRFNEDQYMLNSDFLHTASSKFSPRFFYATSDQNVSLASANVPGFAVRTGNIYIAGSVAHTWTLSTNLLNEGRFGFNRLKTAQRPDAPFKFSDVGILEAPQNDPLPMITITGSYTMVVGQYADRVQDSFQFDDSLSWQFRRHSIRFGGGLTRFTRNFKNPGQNAALTFQSFADFLLGLNAAQNGTGTFSNIFSSVNLTGLFDRTVKMTEGAAFVQDDYHVASSLTMNLGLRYEFDPPLTETSGRFSNFDVSLLNPTPPAAGTLAGLVVAKNYQGTPPAGVTQTNNDTIMTGNGTHNAAPRVGFAWGMLPNSSRLVLRGGYGVYYSKVTGQVLTQNTTSQPFGLIQSLGGPQNAAATFADPFPKPLTTTGSFPIFLPYSPATSLTVNAVDPNIRPGRTQQYNLNIQAALAGTLFEVGYVGTRGADLQRTLAVNQAALASAASPIRGVTTNTVANIPQRVPYQGWTSSGLQQVQSKALMRYNGLETSVTKRFSAGLQLLASYTWSKTLETDPDGGGGGNQNDDRSRYGSSLSSRPRRFVVSYLYELPWLKAATGWEKNLLGNWSIGGVTTLQAGHPLAITGTNASNVYGITNDRVQFAPGCTHSSLATPGPVNGKLNSFFNTNCINRRNLDAPFDASSNPAVWPIVEGAATGFGNSGVGIVRGPDQRAFDIALAKLTRTRWPNEGATVEFRTEFFNAFNTPNFSDPAVSVSNSTFGRITSTSIAGRIIQFSLKLGF
jgi:hypothetical protein